jgi:energy-coupling factor transporter ATP-binding protein EcfA2
MFFKKLTINEWQQFEAVEIDFHENLTILTGANGSGKTTILNLLARHFGWTSPSLGTPKKEKKTGSTKFWSRIFSGVDKSEVPNIGKIEYGNGQVAELQVKNSQAPQYQVKVVNQQSVNCFYIPSHRSIYRYQPLTTIPIAKKNKANAFTEVTNVVKGRYQSGNEGNSSSYFMKSILIGWIIQGYGVKSDTQSFMPSDNEQAQNFRGFVEVLRKVLPKTLGFNDLEIREMEVVFVCNEGKDEFLLETVSGGISALIDMAWQVYMYSTKDNEDCTVLIDEVENHLHPTMQRQVLPDLISAFPRTRFIISTHSPLVVGSVLNSSIHALRYNETNKIESKRLDFQNKARTASEILDEVLGVSVTMPLWAEEKLISIVEKYQDKKISAETLALMREELDSIGLERFMPSAITSSLEKND